MMAMLQNAFANSSSSLIQSKITGNLVFVLLSPLSYREIFFAYVLASVVRGLAVGLGVYLMTLWFFDVPLSSFPWVFVFALMGSALLGALGLIAGIWAEKFDQLAAFQNFVISAADVFVGRVLYDPLAAALLARLVPPESVFLHDRWVSLRFLQRFRYFALCQPWDCSGCFLAVSWLTLRMLKTGYKIRLLTSANH